MNHHVVSHSVESQGEYLLISFSKYFFYRNYRDKSHQTASEIMRGGEALHQDIGEAEAGHHTESEIGLKVFQSILRFV